MSAATPAPDAPAPSGSVADDPIQRARFGEAAQMFRHFVLMRYYSLLGFGAASAALAALYFQYKVLDPEQSRAIRVLAAVVSLSFIGFEYRIGQLITHFQNELNEIAARWKHSEFVPPGKVVGMFDLTSIVVIYFGTAVAWAVFAYRPNSG